MRRTGLGTTTRKPWHLRGKEAAIAELRDKEQRTWSEIAIVMGCSDEGARRAYVRWQRQREAA